MAINISDNNPRVNYTATSGQTVFTVPFEFFASTDLTVYVDGSVLAVSDYTVTGGSGSTGSITTDSGQSTGAKIAIVRDVPLERTTDLTSTYSASSLNDQLDRIVTQIADLDDRVSRSISLNDYEVGVSLDLPATATRLGKTIQFNSSTGALEIGPSGNELTSIASIASEITALDGIKTNITTVAGAITNVNSVGSNISSVTSVASNISNVNTVNTNIANVNSVAGSISDLNDVADSLDQVELVGGSISNVDIVGPAIANVNTVAGDISNINTVAGISANITTVAGITADISTVNSNSANINLVATNIDDVNDVANVITKVTTVADNIANVNTVAPSVSYLSTVANNIANINTLAPISADITTVAGVASSVSNAAANAAAAEAAKVAAEAAQAAAELAADNFDDTYLGAKSSNPTADNDGDALTAGDLYFSTTDNNLKVYTGSAWQAAALDASGFVDVTGDSMTGNLLFGDGDAVRFGTHGDLTIEHDLNNSNITGSNNRPLNITTNGTLNINSDNIYFREHAASNTYMEMRDGGGYDHAVRIFHSGTDVRLETTSTGIAVTGNATFADNGKAIFGAGSDLQIYHDGSNSYISDQGTGDLRILAGQLSVKSASGNTDMIYAVNGGAVTLYNNGSPKLATTSTGIDVTGTVTADGLTVDGNVGIGTSSPSANLHIASTSPTFLLDDTDSNVVLRMLAGSTASYIQSGTDVVSDSAAPLVFGSIFNTTEWMRIDSAGNVGIGTSSPNSALDVAGEITLKGTSSSFASAAQPRLYRSGSSAGSYPFNDFGHLIIQSRGDGANRDIIFATGTAGANKTVIDSSGNVGIGTSSPTQPVHLSNSSTAYYLAETTGTGTSAGIRVKGDASADYTLFTTQGTNQFAIYDNAAGTERFRIDSAGNVGIGVTNPASYDWSNTIDLVVGNTAGSSGLSIVSSTTSGGNIAFADGTTGNERYRGYIYYDHASDYMSYWTAGSERLRITSAGNVGIGTSSPAGVLDVRTGGTQQVIIGNSGTYTGSEYGELLFKEQNTELARVKWNPSGNTFQLINNIAGPMTFATNNTERMRLDASGNVGIGTSSPAAPLEVSTSSADYRIQLTHASGQNKIKSLDGDQSTFRNLIYDAAQHMFETSGSEAMRIDASGNLLVGKTSSDQQVAGTTLFSNGKLSPCVSGDTVIYANRISNDGNIMEFRKDGSTVGSIGSYGSGSGMYLGTGDTGIAFNSTDDNVFPRNPSTNSPRDNAIDLGSSTARFKNLYLSNAIYLGQPSGTTMSYISDFQDDLYIFNKEAAGVMIFGTANTERMRIDSSGSVGIGTSSPSSLLTVHGSQPIITLSDPDTGSTSTISGNSGHLILNADSGSDASNNTIDFQVDNSQKMRLDASGNLLVGTTDALPATNNDANGIALRADGNLMTSRSGAVTARFNRGTSDGDIVAFHKDGSTVGSIGVQGGDTYFAGTSKGIKAVSGFIGATNTTGVLQDNNTDLGSSSYRFKDLYLSGGVYLGGVGSANKLDDYEEGTWTPAMGNVTATISSYGTKYTKIGRIVHAYGYIVLSSLDNADTSSVSINGLPYTVDTSGFSQGSISRAYNVNELFPSTALDDLTGPRVEGTSILWCLASRTGTSPFLTYADCNSSGQFSFAVTYYIS